LVFWWWDWLKYSNINLSIHRRVFIIITIIIIILIIVLFLFNDLILYLSTLEVPNSITEHHQEAVENGLYPKNI